MTTRPDFYVAMYGSTEQAATDPNVTGYCFGQDAQATAETLLRYQPAAITVVRLYSNDEAERLLAEATR